MREISIKYNGTYPNLCSGTLIVTVDGHRWVFPPHCLSSGGSVWFDDEGDEQMDEGPWSVYEWPTGFPDNLKPAVLDAINEHISYGCCGGCI